MERLTRFEGASVEWIQPRTMERYFELWSGESLLGSLTFRSAWGSLAVAETADGAWSFKRVGFLNPRVTVRVLGEERDAAVYQPKFWGDGVLTTADIRIYAWRPTNFWATEWAFTDREGRAVLKMGCGVTGEKLADLFKTQMTVDLYSVEACRDLLPVLVPLGLYLFILRQQDAGAAAAASAGAS